ncbi:MAG TPA: MotA/TolQ/ExbB proton channel family protein [Planctomycetaceae bacterium]|nr:MotA/TolQ/ExbB proton channel family protein [Planctomycetaceae bacterium]
MAATITVVCPNCQYPLRAKVEHIGKKGKCPSCQSIVPIRPAAGEIAPATMATLQRAAVPAAASSRTDVPPWLSGLFGAAATVALYLAVFFPVRATLFGQLFLDRGIIPYLTTLVTCWGIAHLVMKHQAVRRERAVAELELKLIPLELGMQVNAENVDQFLDHISSLPPRDQRSILARRIRGALEHFKHRNSVPEVQEYLSSQAEIDASTVDSGYTLLRSFIWCVPILGFIGTVMGISNAVGGLIPKGSAEPAASTPADLEPSAPRGEQAQPAPADDLKQAMGTVTAGLSTAFDTTLLALSMAILLLFPTEALRKSEYGMLDRIEEFCNESLLRRMAETRGATADMPGVVRDALHSAFQEHQRWLAQWQAQVAQLGQVIGGDFEQAVARLQERLSEAESGRLAQLRDSARAIEELFAQFGEATRSWRESAEQSLRSVQASIAASERLGGALARNLQLACETSQQLSGSTVPTTPTVSVAPLFAGPDQDGERSRGLFGRLFGRDKTS